MESSINQPHPDSPEDEAEAFFGPDPDAQTAVAVEEPEDLDPGAFASPDFEPEEPPAAPDPTPADDAGTTGSTGEPAEQPEGVRQAPTVPPSQPAPQKQRGSVSRQYIVFQRLALTKRVLEHLLAELESGERGGEPRYAFFELHRTDARNANEAVTAAYDKHHERVGDTVDMAAVSNKSFQVRHLEPAVPQKVTAKISVL